MYQPVYYLVTLPFYPQVKSVLFIIPFTCICETFSVLFCVNSFYITVYDFVPFIVPQHHVYLVQYVLCCMYHGVSIFMY